MAGERHQQLRRFSTFHRWLQEIAAWLRAEQITHAAMEATGVYWRLRVVLMILTHRQVGSRHDAR
jgi:hypothetical protein